MKIKGFIFGLAVFCMIGNATYVALRSNSSGQIDKILLRNIEALAKDEVYGDENRKIDCYRMGGELE